jgi:hypothetical protein
MPFINEWQKLSFKNKKADMPELFNMCRFPAYDLFSALQSQIFTQLPRSVMPISNNASGTLFERMLFTHGTCNIMVRWKHCQIPCDVQM